MDLIDCVFGFANTYANNADFCWKCKFPDAAEHESQADSDEASHKIRGKDSQIIIHQVNVKNIVHIKSQNHYIYEMYKNQHQHINKNKKLFSVRGDTSSGS